MITLRYFASTRDAMGQDEEAVEMPQPVMTVDTLREWLVSRGEPWSKALSPDRRLLAAVNHEMVSAQSRVEDGDEVAYFPPVTGG